MTLFCKGIQVWRQRHKFGWQNRTDVLFNCVFLSLRREREHCRVSARGTLSSGRPGGCCWGELNNIAMFSNRCWLANETTSLDVSWRGGDCRPGGWYCAVWHHKLPHHRGCHTRKCWRVCLRWLHGNCYWLRHFNSWMKIIGQELCSFPVRSDQWNLFCNCQLVLCSLSINKDWMHESCWRFVLVENLATQSDLKIDIPQGFQ